MFVMIIRHRLPASDNIFEETCLNHERKQAFLRNVTELFVLISQNILGNTLF